jgi:hypothetical protein
MDDDAGAPAAGMGADQGKIPTPAATADAGAASTAPIVPGPEDLAEAMGKVRPLLAGALPDLVPELLVGNSLEELVASIEPAKQAYQRIMEQLRAGSDEGGTGAASDAAGSGANVSVAAMHSAVAPRPIPVGQPARQGMGLDLEALRPGAKIAEGLRRNG